MKIYVVNELDIDDYSGEFTCSYCHSAFSDLKLARVALKQLVADTISDLDDDEDKYDLTEGENETRIVLDNFIYIFTVDELELISLSEG